MVTQKGQGGRRGRPRGETEQGQAQRERLYAIACEQMRREGYGATTLRSIAAEAGVSHALLYRYFPSKGALVLALYERLSAEFVEGAHLESGSWRRRSVAALRGSLATLAPWRGVLSEASPVLVGAGEQGLFASSTRFSLERVRGVFLEAVSGARDRPRGERAAALGRLLYLMHLGLILTWLLDRSKGQRATAGLLALVEKGLPLAAAALRIPGVWSWLLRLDVLLEEALLEEAPPSSA